jgi:hypothetical protein
MIKIFTKQKLLVLIKMKLHAMFGVAIRTNRDAGDHVFPITDTASSGSASVDAEGHSW